MDQDWTEVVLRKKTPKPSNPNTAISQAKREGMQVETIKKYNAGTNKKSVSAVPARKLDEDSEELSLPKVDRSVSQAIIRARAALNLKQQDLAVKISENVRIVNDYEAGRAIPSQPILAKMEKVLKVKLRGKDIGSPIEERGKK